MLYYLCSNHIDKQTYDYRESIAYVIIQCICCQCKYEFGAFANTPNSYLHCDTFI